MPQGFCKKGVLTCWELHSAETAEQATQLCVDLKAMAKELNIPVICITQLPRNIDYRNDKRPILEDLRSQGAIINDSDLILFLYRDSYYNPSSPTGMTTECIIAKNRYC